MVRMFSSPRMRRRLGWSLVLLAVAAAVATGISLLPSGGEPPERFTPGSPAAEPVASPPPREVPLRRAERAAITGVLARFVPAAVERRDPAAAYDLVTPDLKAGQSRADWKTGDIPVYPFRTRLHRFAAWRLNYSFPREVSLELLLPPENRKLGPIAFTAVLERSGDRWLVDSFIPAATFSAPGAAPRITAQPDLAPNPSYEPTASRLSAGWLLLPLGLLLSIPLLAPVLMFLRGR